MKIENITKRYGERVALDGVTMEIPEGKITAILGESGAGKTTLLNVIAGLTDFEGMVDGAPYQKKHAECSYLFQDAKLLPNLTVEKNLKFVLPKSEWGRIGETLSRVGLEGREGAYPHELSGGEKQRVAIARAFLYPHKLLLMDEPFSSLDLSHKRTLIELIGLLWEERKSTIVFVTHDVHEAALLASRAIVLKEGKCVFETQIDTPRPREFLSAQPQEKQLIAALLK